MVFPRHGLGDGVEAIDGGLPDDGVLDEAEALDGREERVGERRPPDVGHHRREDARQRSQNVVVVVAGLRDEGDELAPGPLGAEGGGDLSEGLDGRQALGVLVGLELVDQERNRVERVLGRPVVRGVHFNVRHHVQKQTIPTFSGVSSRSRSQPTTTVLFSYATASALARTTWFFLLPLLNV